MWAEEGKITTENAVVLNRTHGWNTRTVARRHIRQNRQQGNANKSACRANATPVVADQPLAPRTKGWQQHTGTKGINVHQRYNSGFESVIQLTGLQRFYNYERWNQLKKLASKIKLLNREKMEVAFHAWHGINLGLDAIDELCDQVAAYKTRTFMTQPKFFRSTLDIDESELKTGIGKKAYTDTINSILFNLLDQDWSSKDLQVGELFDKATLELQNNIDKLWDTYWYEIPESDTRMTNEDYRRIEYDDRITKTRTSGYCSNSAMFSLIKKTEILVSEETKRKIIKGQIANAFKAEQLLVELFDQTQFTVESHPRRPYTSVEHYKDDDYRNVTVSTTFQENPTLYAIMTMYKSSGENPLFHTQIVIKDPLTIGQDTYEYIQPHEFTVDLPYKPWMPDGVTSVSILYTLMIYKQTEQINKDVTDNEDLVLNIPLLQSE